MSIMVKIKGFGLISLDFIFRFVIYTVLLYVYFLSVRLFI